jgi:hypothetical protein
VTVERQDPVQSLGVALALETAPEVALIEIGLAGTAAKRSAGASTPRSGAGCFWWR